MSNGLLAAAALALDQWLGDPSWLPHPVIFIGRIITYCDRLFNRRTWTSRSIKRLLGLLTVVIVVGSIGIFCWVILRLVAWLSPWLSFFVAMVITWTTVASRGLREAGQDVHRALLEDGIRSARQRVAMYVGRDTNSLSEQEVIRAVVETLAENIVDAIVSPIFFACLGGAPLAIAYRAVNTLDSMIGYKNDKYQDFGWAAARLDDVANYIPARLTTIFLLFAIRLCQLDVRGAWKVMVCDRHNHPSPNGGIPESMVAGALGVQLGGVNYYGGILHTRGLLGSPNRLLHEQDIIKVIRLVNFVTMILITILCVLSAIVVILGGTWF